MKITLMALMALFFSTANIAEAKKPSAQAAVNTACTAEAEIAKCGNDKAGRGLLRCLRTHRKGNRDFKISESCETSLKRPRTDVKNNTKGKSKHQ